MRIEVLGPGCERCTTLYDNARAAVVELGLDAEVARVDGLRDIARYGVAVPPALAIDGDVKLVGAVLSVAQLKKLLARSAQS